MGDGRTARLGIVGRNLFTSTKYSGYDPDVSGGGANPFAYRVDYFTYPIFKTFTFMLELGDVPTHGNFCRGRPQPPW
jgi:hypothetical protein